MKAKSDSKVQGCAGKPLNSRCATISYMEKSEKVVASNRTPKIEKTPFSLNWCKIYDFEPRRVCEDVRGRGRFIAEIDPTWTPDRVPIGRITPLCLFYNPHPLCSLWLMNKNQGAQRPPGMTLAGSRLVDCLPSLPQHPEPAANRTKKKLKEKRPPHTLESEIEPKT